MQNNEIDFSTIKLVIWDLDDTFWSGTISEGEIHPIQPNINLLKRLTDCGIINSICSKNDAQQVKEELKRLQIDDFFVFNSIDWTPKGERVARMIKEMGLRPINTLFIDDNKVNLNEVEFYAEGILVSEPSIIPKMIRYFDSVEIKDEEHKRLHNYKILERKRDSKVFYSDNEKFLYSTNTRVDICYDCCNHLDRISELVSRTNQLNFTKVRSSKKELAEIIADDSIKTGYVTVHDNFGDYGIVGFFAIKNRKCLHFLFSCRTIGQGVEQYVYSSLNYPELDIQGKVVNVVKREPAPLWINQNCMIGSVQKQGMSQAHGKILLKGPCDLMSLSSYIEHKENVIEEFNYVSLTRHNEINAVNHSLNYLLLPFLPEDDKRLLLNECIFIDEGVFTTHLFDNDISIIVLSTLNDPHFGVYRRKGTEIRIAFGDWDKPLTEEKFWDYYILSHKYANNFTKEYLLDFSSKYEFEGRLSAQDTFQNFQILLNKLSVNTKICFILGSEIPYEGESSPTRRGREKQHKQLNSLIRSWAKRNTRVLFLDLNDFIDGQNSFNGHINHFKRGVYFKAACRLNEIIQVNSNQSLRPINKMKKVLYDVHYCVKNVENYLQSRFSRNCPLLYQFFKRLYHQILNEDK